MGDEGAKKGKEGGGGKRGDKEVGNPLGEHPLSSQGTRKGSLGQLATTETGF